MQIKLRERSVKLLYVIVPLALELVVFPAFGASLNGSSTPKSISPARQIVTQTCGACHGITGNSVASVFPNLAGQIAPYIKKQLQDFSSGARVNSIMTGIVKPLSDTQMQELALYFSKQTLKKKDQVPVKVGSPEGKLLATGNKIFHGGIASSAVPACASCHGPTAIGLPPKYPRLAAQRAPYIKKQLFAFKRKSRSNDGQKVMRTIAGRLNASQINAVATYLSSLP